MDIDFSLVLVCLVAFCGALWLLDHFLIKQSRDEAVADYERNKTTGKSEQQIQE